jgi:hypothetical protein
MTSAQGRFGLCLITFVIGVCTVAADALPREHRQRHEAADIAKLAALTRVDHSTIFFRGHTKSGYVRDGVFHSVALTERKEPRGGRCRGRAVSRNGSQIAYLVPADNHEGCTILVRDLRTDLDSPLVDIEESLGPLEWSWDDGELAYQRRVGIFAVSTKDRRERSVARLPLRVGGREPAGSWRLRSIDWFHQRSNILVNADICVPTGSPGECKETGHVLIVKPDDSRMVALGLGAAVSPLRDQIGFVTATTTVVTDADQPNRRRIASVPFMLLSIPPFAREETWWSRLVWSPQGDRFWFSTVLDEEFNSNYYLVSVRDGARRRLLANTPLDLTDWR